MINTFFSKGNQILDSSSYGPLWCLPSCSCKVTDSAGNPATFLSQAAIMKFVNGSPYDISLSSDFCGVVDWIIPAGESADLPLTYHTNHIKGQSRVECDIHMQWGESDSHKNPNMSQYHPMSVISVPITSTNVSPIQSPTSSSSRKRGMTCRQIWCFVIILAAIIGVPVGLFA